MRTSNGLTYRIGSARDWIDKHFQVRELGTNLRTELLAGVSTYLSLAYIFVVNPAILAGTGIDASAVFFATVIASATSTLFMGFWARLPFALAPGLEMNGFFAFVVVGTLGFTWNEALGAVFWSGVLCVMFTIMPIRRAIIAAIPDGLKSAISLSVGVFVVTIGLVLSGVVAFVQGRMVGLNLVVTPKVIAMLIGLAIAMALGLRRMKLPGGMLVAIVAATLYARSHGIVVASHAEFSPAMLSAVCKLDLVPSHLSAFLPVLLVFFLLDFYGSLGKFIGLTTGTSLSRDGDLIRIERAMGTDAGGTIIGAVLGTSSIITYVESAVGIAVGGRTGIVAIVCGLLMLASLAFAPLVGFVPVEATAGILVYVGYLLVRNAWRNRDLARFDFAVSAAMALISFFTFGLDKAMLCGFAAYSLASLKSRRSDPILVISAGLLLLAVLLPIWLARHG